MTIADSTIMIDRNTDKAKRHIKGINISSSGNIFRTRNIKKPIQQVVNYDKPSTINTLDSKSTVHAVSSNSAKSGKDVKKPRHINIYNFMPHITSISSLENVTAGESITEKFHSDNVKLMKKQHKSRLITNKIKYEKINHIVRTINGIELRATVNGVLDYKFKVNNIPFEIHLIIQDMFSDDDNAIYGPTILNGRTLGRKITIRGFNNCRIHLIEDNTPPYVYNPMVSHFKDEWEVWLNEIEEASTEQHQ